MWVSYSTRLGEFDYALGSRLARSRFFSLINNKVHIFRTPYDRSIFIHDLTKKFPWPDNSVDTIYSSHTLEHLSRQQGLLFLRECHRVLAMNGLVRIIVPDLFAFVSLYVEGQIRADEFLERLGVLCQSKSGSWLKRKLAPFIMFPHKCMYDTKSLVGIMTEIGFGVQPKKPLESDIPDIINIEIYERAQNSVIVEGTKKE